MAIAPAMAPAIAAEGSGAAPIAPHSAPTSEMWLVRSVNLALGYPTIPLALRATYG